MAYADYLDEYGNYLDPQQNVTSGAVQPSPSPQATATFSGGLAPASLAPPPHAAASPVTNGQIAPVGAGGYSGPKDFSSLVRYWKASHPASAPDIPGLIAFMNGQGLQVSNAVHNGMPSDDKLLYNGQTYDLGTSFGSPSGQWFNDFQPQGAQEGDGAFAIDPSYLAPYTQQFAAPADAALPQFQAPGGFQAPNAQTLLNDPGYKFREGRITDQIQNSASARGILNSTGTLDDIMRSVGDFAGQEYGNAYARDFNAWNTDWSHALDTYNANYGRANTVYSRAQNEYNTAKDLYFANQDRPYDKIFKGIDLGSRMAAA